MKSPINTELRHVVPGYDPAKAHQYYEEHKHLKGRKKGSAQTSNRRNAARHPHRNAARAKQKIALQNSVHNLEAKLGKLEALIRKKEATLRKDQAQKKIAARKKKDTPKTAADKSKAARDSKQYRKKHHQQLKTKAKQAASKSGGGHKSGSKAQKPSDMSIANLKALATKVKGQIAVAKQKLAAL